MDLKTIKDFEYGKECKAARHIFLNHQHLTLEEDHPGDFDCVDSGIAYEALELFREELKQEAIKWIKEMKQNPTQELANMFGVNIDFHEQEFNLIINFIKHFFGISEEDLNEKGEEEK